jgi:hypothetical protein
MYGSDNTCNNIITHNALGLIEMIGQSCSVYVHMYWGKNYYSDKFSYRRSLSMYKHMSVIYICCCMSII